MFVRKISVAADIYKLLVVEINYTGSKFDARWRPLAPVI